MHTSKVMALLFGCLFILILATAQHVDARAVEIVLDYSGSMRGALPDGQTKIDAAKKALEIVVSELPQDIFLAFRIFGAQSETTKRDCQDSQLLVPFAKVQENRNSVISAAQGMAPRGYTPITYALTLGADDFSAGDPEERVIVLVSDGKENCQGDPCALARALKQNDVNLVIHTVGFDIDAAGKSQLQCIARVTDGLFFSANSAGELASVLSKAVTHSPPAVTTVIKLPEKTKAPGRLVIEGPELHAHKVTNAETGEEVGRISLSNTSLQLPEGIYNVAFGKNIWNSIEVLPGETTTLRPAHLGVSKTIISGHKVVDPESGEVHASISPSKSMVTLMPGRFEVMFGAAAWPVNLEEGETLILNPGVVEASGLDIRGYAILDLQEKKAATSAPAATTCPCLLVTTFWIYDQIKFRLPSRRTKRYNSNNRRCPWYTAI